MEGLPESCQVSGQRTAKVVWSFSDILIGKHPGRWGSIDPQQQRTLLDRSRHSRITPRMSEASPERRHCHVGRPTEPGAGCRPSTKTSSRKPIHPAAQGLASVKGGGLSLPCPVPPRWRSLNTATTERNEIPAQPHRRQFRGKFLAETPGDLLERQREEAELQIRVRLEIPAGFAEFK